MKQLMNVSEPMTLYDTVLVSPYVESMRFHDGWYPTFAAFGSANEIPFFNVRNRNHHLAYNNQETRDQVPYGMQIFSIGIQFFAPQIASQAVLTTLNGGAPLAIEEIQSAVWEADLPQHASFEFKVNQDIRLKQSCAMAPSGMGPFGGGMGHGDPTVYISHETNVAAYMKGMTSQGIPELDARWPFPVPIDVPLRANISLVVKFSEWARTLLQTMIGPHYYLFAPVGGGAPSSPTKTIYGLRASLGVKRLVQQRGEYHVGGKV